MKLTHHCYGKERVRVLRVLKENGIHTPREVTVGIALQGDLQTSFTEGDNSRVVPTDTMKNTITALAQDHLHLEIERFGQALGEHFLSNFPWVHTVFIDISETCWSRLSFDGAPHAHSFQAQPNLQPCTSLVSTREGHEITSGVNDYMVMKTTGSGFVGYPVDAYTTLPETTDRIMATKITARWTFRSEPESYLRVGETILREFLREFALPYSPSVQLTLWNMANAALREVPELQEVTIEMPNKHYLLVDLARFGRENHNEIFLPTDEPHGQICATVSRDE
jgi:urate oxidase